MSSELIKHTTDASFDADVLQADRPVLVDYWAEWCGPCKMIAPILDDVAEQYGDKIQIAKMNVDENRDVPAKFGIRGIPTLMLFKDGQLAATKVGALSKAQLTAFIDGNLQFVLTSAIRALKVWSQSPKFQPPRAQQTGRRTAQRIQPPRGVGQNLQLFVYCVALFGLALPRTPSKQRELKTSVIGRSALPFEPSIGAMPVAA
jgi:thioredoxin 1